MNESLKISHAGLKFISDWEGCVLKPYRDIAGYRTIGVGHLITAGESFPDGIEISLEKALQILAVDVQKCEKAIKNSIKVELNQNQFDALCSFGFNCGTGVYTSSGACKMLNQGNYDQVPVRLLDWSKARIKGVLKVSPGLYNRRKSEGQLFARQPQIVAVETEPEVTEIDVDRIQGLIAATIWDSVQNSAPGGSSAEGQPESDEVKNA